MTTQTTPKTLVFSGYNCVVQKNTFPDGSTCISLVDADDGMPIVRASVSVDGITVGDNQTLIRNSSECEGMAQVLIDNGIISPVGAKVFEINDYGTTVVLADLLV
jgi:hypothetical protein